MLCVGMLAAAGLTLLAVLAAGFFRPLLPVAFMPAAVRARALQWVRGTGLKPFVDPLPEPERAQFLADYERRIAAAYPPRADGRLLLAFPRLFFVATRSA